MTFKHLSVTYPPERVTAHTRDIVHEELCAVVNRAVMAYGVEVPAVISILLQMAEDESLTYIDAAPRELVLRSYFLKCNMPS